MLPHLGLHVRYGKHGSISSPVSTSGYVAQLVFVMAVVAFIVIGIFRRGRPAEWALALPIGSFLLFRALRDLIAWVTASASQREHFRAEIERARADREQARLTTPPMTRRECVEDLALLALTAGFFGLVLVRVALGNRPGDNPSAAICAAVLVSGWLGGSWAVVRRYRRTSGSFVR